MTEPMETDYHDQKHAERTAQINATIQRESAKKTEAKESDESTPAAVEVEQQQASDPVGWTPGMEMGANLEKQREAEEQWRVRRRHEEAKKAERDERQRQRYQAREAERARQFAEYNAPELARAREEFQALLDAEIARQEKLIGDVGGDWSYAANAGKSRSQVVLERAHAVLREREIEAPTRTLESVDCEVRKLSERVEALEAKMSMFRIPTPR
jgi:hypothetical protein